MIDDGSTSSNTHQTPRRRAGVVVRGASSSKKRKKDKDEFSRLASVVQSSLDAIIGLTLDGTITSWNPAAERLYGYSVEEAVGQSISILAPLDHSDEMPKLLRKLKCGGPGEQLEAVRVRKDGQQLHVSLTVFPVRDVNGQIFAAATIERDVTEHNYAEERLARQAVKVELLFKAAALAAETASVEQALQGCVNIICEMTGWPVGHAYLVDDGGRELLPTGIWYIEDASAYIKLREATEKLQIAPGVGLPGRIWQTGEPVWITDARYVPSALRPKACGNVGVRGAFGFPIKVKGETVAVLEFFADQVKPPDPSLLMMVRTVGEQMGRVIERKRAEQFGQRLASIVESSDDSIVSKDLNGIITSWNRGAERLFGYTAEEVIGKSVMTLIPPDRHDEEPGIFYRIRRGQRIDHYETVRRRKDGSLVEISLTVSPIKNAEGRIIGASTIARDITEHKRSEEELRTAKEQAELANCAKSTFLATMSHELRTPLNAIIGFSEVIRDQLFGPAISDRYLDYARHIHESGHHLLNLVNDVLDLAKIEASKRELKEAVVDLSELISSSVHIMEEQARQKQITLKLDVAMLPPLRADDCAIKQMMLNLLSNSVKFTPTSGEITVRAYRDMEGIHIAVADTGIGIRESEIEKVLTPFAQARNRINQRHRGTGLGLPIVKSLIELHGGRFELRSTPDVGTTAILHFAPDRAIEATAQDPPHLLLPSQLGGEPSPCVSVTKPAKAQTRRSGSGMKRTSSSASPD